MQRREIQQSRCEFPGCNCRCMHRHNTQEICVRCMHHCAWHRPLTQTNSEPPAPPRASQAQEILQEPPETQIQSQQSIIDNLLTLLDLDSSERTKCCVCLERESEVVLKPCGHARFCSTCMENNNVHRCPICRTSIQNKVSFIPL